MKKVIFYLLLCWPCFTKPNIHALHCGTRGTLIGTIASDFLIPDFFPPEHFLIRMLVAPFIDLTICDDLGKANLGIACAEHDNCYSESGVDKEICDLNMKNGWQEACLEKYHDHESSKWHNYCLNLCQDAASLMYDIFSYDDGLFCPSCIAFNTAQKANAKP